MFRKLVAAGKAEDRLRARTLSDITPGTVLEATSWRKTTTQIGDAIMLTVVESQRGEGRNQFNLMIAARFEEECAKIPCVLLYVGMKDTKGGMKCHDLKFVKADDKEVFRKTDDEIIIPSDDEDDEYIPPARKDLAAIKRGENALSGKGGVDDCEVCAVDGLDCIGNCEECGVHLPINGSQCRCRLRRYKF